MPFFPQVSWSSDPLEPGVKTEPRPDPIAFEYSALRHVSLGRPAVEVLGEHADRLGAKRVMVLASGTLSRNTGEISAISEALGSRFAICCDRIRAHTPRIDVLAALQEARKHDVDLLVTVGGGSIIDAGKAIQFCLNAGIENEQELLDYANFSDGRRGAKADKAPPLVRERAVRQIAVPTTLSGAEFSNNAGVTDTDKGAKEGYKAPGLCAESIIYDPALSLHTPEWLWLSTAIRSLDHAIEGFLSPDAHAFMQVQFLSAISLFAQSLRACKDAPGNLQARQSNQQATWLACCALGKVRHGASHGIGYILGGLCGVPHGITSCVMLPAVLQWNEAGEGQQDIRDKQRAIAAALGDASLSAADQLRTLVKDLGLPVRLQDAGVSAGQLAQIAALAAQHRVVRANCRAVNSEQDVAQILELAVVR